MSEIHSPELKGKIELSPEDPIIVICMNGRTRSKYVARMLADLGFTNVRVAGLHDPYSRNLIRQLNKFKAIITVGQNDVITTLTADQRFPHLPPPMLHVPITEQEHAQLHLLHELGRTDEIKSLLQPKIESLPLAIKNHTNQ